MTWLDAETAAFWRTEGKRYAQEINEYVRKGMETDWAVEMPEPKEDARNTVADQVVRMIREANAAGETARLREELPPATWPLTGAFEKKIQAIREIVFLDNRTVAFTSGSAYEDGCVHVAGPEGIETYPSVRMIGVSPGGGVYALVDETGIRVTESLNGRLEGKERFRWTWDAIQERIRAAAEGIETLGNAERPVYAVDRVIPLAGSETLLLIGAWGVYRVEHERAELLHPTVAELKEMEMEDSRIDMQHGAVSPDERWAAFGNQGSNHHLLNLETGKTYEFYPISSYPHYSLFTEDGREAWFNACHFYNGSTLRISLEEAVLPGAEQKEDWPVAEDEARVYAAAAWNGGVLVGDAYGYLRRVSQDGEPEWRHFLGSTISGMAVSPDRRTLAVGTYGGMLHLLDLTSQEMDEYSIGTGTLRETLRVVVWRGEKPMVW